MSEQLNVVVDIDGTLIDNRHLIARAYAGLPVDLMKDAHDAPAIQPVVDWVKAHYAAGHRICIVTARPFYSALDTEKLLERLGIQYHEIAFRPGNEPSDVKYKRRWFMTHLRSHPFTVAIDDNPYIVDMLEMLHVPVIQVPGWDFTHRGPIELELPEVHS